jgi:hypothetical protein
MTAESYRIAAIVGIVREVLDRELDVTYLEDRTSQTQTGINLLRRNPWYARQATRNSNIMSLTDKNKTDQDEAPMIAVIGAAGCIGSRVVADNYSAYPEWNMIAIDNCYRAQL